MNDREKMIIDFYENGKLPLVFRIDMKIQEIKYKWKHRKELKNEFRYNRMVDSNRSDTISNNSNDNVRTNELYQTISKGE